MSDEVKKLQSSLSDTTIAMTNYFLDPIQYDGRTKRILKYFYLNNEPLFYLACSYCSK